MKRIGIVLGALLLAAAVFLAIRAMIPRETQPEQPVLMFRYADNQPKGYPTTQAADYFAELVEKRTDGKIVIRVFPDSVLGNEISVFRQMQFGGIDFARLSVSTLSEFVPEISILQLPYLFEDAEHMWRVLDGEIGKQLLESIRPFGLAGMSWFDAGSRNIYTKTPVTSLDDIRHLRIRVQESDFLSRMVSLWGAVPVKISYESVYSALQTGKIDGAENNWPSYEATGHYEVAPYYLLDAHSRLPEAQLISKNALEEISALGDGYVDIVLQCAAESAQYERELWKEREARSEAVVRESGCIVTELSEDERKRFQDAVAPIYEEFSGERAEMIRKIQEH